MDTYKRFLKSKSVVAQSHGIKPVEPHAILFPFQRDIVKWALRRGRACIFADCGMGKTFIQIEWARQIPDNVLISIRGDKILSPFAGIGSEGHVALLNERRFIGAELKASYWKQAVANLQLAESESSHDLFSATA